MIKEACIENFTGALSAQLAGADRIELCENLAAGGTTPSYGTMKACMERLSIPVFVMIRPRGGDFCYSPPELEIMKTDIAICRQLGVPAVVFGLLTNDRRIDEEHTRELIGLARPMQVTFHKAFDELDESFRRTRNFNPPGSRQDPHFRNKSHSPGRNGYPEPAY